MKVATLLLVAASLFALTGCPDSKGSGSGAAPTSTAAAGTAKPAAPAGSGTGGW